MKTIDKFRILLSFVLATASAANAGVWSDSAVSALNGKRHEKFRSMVAARGGDGNLPADFSLVVLGAGSAAGERTPFKLVSMEFESSLAKGVGNSTLSNYLAEIGSSTNSTQVREYLGRIVLTSSHSLNAQAALLLQQSLLEMAGSSSTPSELRVFILKNLGSYPPLLDINVLFPFISSQNYSIRTAACQAVDRRVRTGRAKGDTAANRTFFDSVKTASGDSLDLDEARMLSAFSEDYSQDYLLAKCAGNPEKIAAVFRNDDAINHPGLVREAMRLSLAGDGTQQLQRAIRYGLKDPDAAVSGFLAGQSSDVEIGLKLLALYPENVRKHAAQVQQRMESPEEGIRNASLALLPYLVD